MLLSAELVVTLAVLHEIPTLSIAETAIGYLHAEAHVLDLERHIVAVQIGSHNAKFCAVKCTSLHIDFRKSFLPVLNLSAVRHSARCAAL